MTRDPGLPAERTILAWARTTFVVVAISCAVAFKSWQRQTGPVGSCATVLAITVALITWLINVRRQHMLRRCRPGFAMGLRHEAHILGASTVALCCAATFGLEL